MPVLPPLDSMGRTAGDVPLLTARIDRKLVRSRARSTRYALLNVVAPLAPRRADRIPVNLAIVLDRSGSMAREKFALSRLAVEQALAQLRPEDRFALVVYDDRVDVLAESTLATAEARRAALARLECVQPRGATDLGSGWMRGCEQVAFSMTANAPSDDSAINRCLLLTDGLANNGIVDRAELIRHANALRERGVQTSTFGVGEDFEEQLLAGMADAGGGHFYFLSAAEQIPELIASEVGEALEVVLPHAAIELRLASGMTGQPLSRFRSRTTQMEDGSSVLRMELGDLVSAQEVELVVGLHFPEGSAGEDVQVEARLMGAELVSCAPAALLRWTYATHEENDRQSRESAVDRIVASLYAGRARSEALECVRARDYRGAQHVLEATARRIRQYAGNDAMLSGIADGLLGDIQAYANTPMSKMDMKARYYQEHNVASSRGPSGKARRKGPEN
jgi:Ca-activated chloride channel homolog